jgi:O-antigen/teichoic acid export membrane protein
VATIALVSGGSILSRIASFALLVYAARALNLRDFGFYSIVTALSIGIANTLVVGIGDMLSGTAVRSPQNLRVLSRLSVTLSATGIIGAAFAATLADRQVTIFLACVVLLLTTVSTMYAMQVLRGISGPISAALCGYVLPSLVRIAVVFVPSGGLSLGSLLCLTAGATAFTALPATLITLFRMRKLVNPIGNHKTVDLRAALAIGVTWLVLNQADIVAISLTAGLSESGSFTPAMRLFEALGAFAIAAKFLSTRSAFEGSGGPKKPILLTLLLYIPAAIVMVLVGSKIVEYMLGDENAWSLSISIGLALSYLFSSIASVLIQFQVSAGKWRNITKGSIAVIVLTLTILPPLTYLFGIKGAVLGDLAIFSVWALMLSRGLWKARST